MAMTRKLAIVATMLALATSAAPASAAQPGGVLVVGDSLAELTSPYLKRYLPGAALTINVGGGYNSYQIFDLFQEAYDPSQSVIVFDAGTNDNPAYPEILAGNLKAVTEAIGDRCMVVPTVHGFTVDGIDNDGKNQVVSEFAAARPGTQVPDWAGAVATHPELMQSDNLHPIAEGADYRAQLIAQGIRGCLNYSSPPAREPVLDARPEMEPVDALSERQSSMVRAIGTEMMGRLAGGVAQQQPLAAVLAMVSLRLGGDA